MSMTFNQFKKQLTDRNIEPHTAIMLATVYEQVLEMAKQIDMMSNIVGSLADTVGNVVELHSVTQGHVKDMRQRFGENVRSEELDQVPLLDEPKKN